MQNKEIVLMYVNCLQGAPEGILDRCAFVRIGTEKVPMTPALKAEIYKHVKFYGTGETVFQLNLVCVSMYASMYASMYVSMHC